MKTCTACGEVKPATEFRPRRARCLVCYKAYRREYRQRSKVQIREYARTHPEQHRSKYKPETAKRWRDANRERLQQTQQRHRPTRAAKKRLALYGVTPEQYAEMVAAQSGCCAICDQPRRLCVDHGHTTGLVRLLLCGPCNLAVGWAEKHGRDAVDALAGYLDWIGIEGRS